MKPSTTTPQNTKLPLRFKTGKEIYHEKTQKAYGAPARAHTAFRLRGLRQRKQHNRQRQNHLGTLPEIIDRLYDTVDVDDEQRDFLKNSVGTVEIPKDQSAYYFGVENLDFEEAVASEPFINAIAFSVCLMRVKDGTDIDELKAEIRRSANPDKWICVDVNPNDVRVESVGDLVLLIMADDSEKYSEASTPSPSKKQNLTKTPKIAMMNINAA